jgi:hypothetical protein
MTQGAIKEFERNPNLFVHPIKRYLYDTAAIGGEFIKVLAEDLRARGGAKDE